VSGYPSWYDDVPSVESQDSCPQMLANYYNYHTHQQDLLWESYH